MALARSRRHLRVAAALATIAMTVGAGIALPGTVEAAAPRTGLSVSLKWADMLGPNSQIDLSSPNLATLDGGGQSIVVGSRVNGCVYAVHLSDGSTTPGWPQQCNGNAVDSTPAVLPVGGGLDDVVVSTGDVGGMNPAARNAGHGSVIEYGPGGNTQWARTLPDVYGTLGGDPAVPASPAIGDTGTGQARIVVGGVSLSLYSLDPATGGTIPGWPQKTADTTFATAAIANVDNSQQIVASSDSTAGPGALDNWNGGASRLMSARGGTVWTDASNEVVTSSPVVGNLDGSGPVAVYGHGRYWGGSDGDGLTAVDAATGALRWERHLGGYTRATPALADLQGNGRLDVVEPTWTADGQTIGGLVFAVDPNGNQLWAVQLPLPPGQTTNTNTIAGGVATADFGEGYQDVVVASGLGFDILDGRTGGLVSSQGLNLNSPSGNFGGDTNAANLNMQNSPLVVPDPSGVGDDIVVAGTYGGVNNDNTQGFIAVYKVTNGSNHSLGSGAWPQYHHDPQLTGSAIAPAPAPGTCSPDVPPCSTQGYWMTATDGGLFAYGNAPFFGSMGGRALSRPVVGIAPTSDHGGYWEVASDGGVFAFGDAAFHGSMGGTRLNQPVVGIAATADGGGYWEVASDGGVFAFGDAAFHGSMGGTRLNQPVVGIATTPAGGGYWEVASDGGLFAFGDAGFFGSMGGSHLNQPVVGISPTTTGRGYWMVASDGGVFNFGDAFFRGSAGNLALNAPVTGVAANS